MERGDDGDARGRGGEGVVVGDFAGQVKLGPLGDGVLQVLAARTGEDRGASDSAVGRAGDQQAGQAEVRLDPDEQDREVAAAQLRRSATNRPMNTVRAP